MTNLLKLGLAILLVFMMTVPAMAKSNLSMGGGVIADVYYYQQDAEGFAADPSRTTPGSGGIAGIPKGTDSDEEDRTNTYFDLNHSSHLWFRWANDDGVGIFLTPYMNGDPTQTAGSKDISGYKHGFRVGVSNVVGWWDITPKLRVIAGKGGYETIFSSDSPGTTMGYDGINKVLGIGYGNIVSSYQNGVRFTLKFSPAVSLKLGLLESRLTDNKSPNDSTEAYLVAALAGMGINLEDTPYHDKPLLQSETGTVADNSTVLPKFELAIPMTFKGSAISTTITPSAMYLEQTFDNIASGADDTITSYGYALGVNFRAGKFNLKTEFNIGQNLKNAGRIGVATCYPFKYEYAATIGNIQSARADDEGKVHDSETTAGWIELNYQFGKAKPALFFGQQVVKRDMPNDADSEATTQFYGINCELSLVGNFVLKPEFMIYDNGDGKLMGDEVEFGKETVAGMQFKWKF